MSYRTILADCPWAETMLGKWNRRHSAAPRLSYSTMSLDQLKALPVPDLAAPDAHLWLWTTNRSLPDGFALMAHWGFRYLAPVHWVKPSGFGAWFVHRTQTLLMGYRGNLDMRPEGRYRPNVLFASPKRGGHSTKPAESYELVEAVSHPPRLEMFARVARPNWTAVGDGVTGEDITTSLERLKSEPAGTLVGDAHP